MVQRQSSQSRTMVCSVPLTEKERGLSRVSGCLPKMRILTDLVPFRVEPVKLVGSNPTGSSIILGKAHRGGRRMMAHLSPVVGLPSPAICRSPPIESWIDHMVGPSTGRLVEVCESPEMRARMTTGSTLPILGMLAAVIGFVGLVFGASLIYENEETFGAVVLIVTVTLIVLVFISRSRFDD